jgi:hypothetical protein
MNRSSHALHKFVDHGDSGLLVQTANDCRRIVATLGGNCDGRYRCSGHVRVRGQQGKGYDQGLEGVPMSRRDETVSRRF